MSDEIELRDLRDAGYGDSGDPQNSLVLYAEESERTRTVVLDTKMEYARHALINSESCFSFTDMNVNTDVALQLDGTIVTGSLYPSSGEPLDEWSFDDFFSGTAEHHVQDKTAIVFGPGHIDGSKVFIEYTVSELEDLEVVL